MDQKKVSFSEETRSVWRDSVHFPTFKPLEEDIQTETAIVGGGISGIAAAYLLAKEGMKVALIEAAQLCSGTTGYTTAKVTAQHGLIYNELIGHFGVEKAKLYYQANREALDWIGRIVREQDVRCGFQKRPALVYATSARKAEEIEKEAEAYRKLGIPGSLSDSIGLPLQVKRALTMPEQAQFHPLMFLHFLISELVKMDVPIYEQTLAVNIEEEPSCVVHTEKGPRIHCREVLICSHFPFYDKAFYFSRMYPERSYLMAVETDQSPEGMYLSAEEPKRSIRSLTLDGRSLVLVGGENHRTGRGENTAAHFQNLAAFAEQVFGTDSIVCRWSAQDYTTLDKVPYIGRLSAGKPHIYVAAGFRKWGMTTGILAARLLADQLLERTNPYGAVFSPSRFAADPMIKRFFIENSQVAGHLISGKLAKASTSIEDLDADEGAVISLNGKRAGAYKDKNGRLTVVDTTCPHMGCEVNWNQGERTWDCPCHGSRFKATGELIDGPAKKPLKQLYAEKRTDGDTRQV